jgi:hypothetical protein
VSFFKNHVAPILHHAAGGVIAAIVLSGGLLAAIKPLRDFIFSEPILRTLLWVLVVVVVILALLLFALARQIRRPHIEIRSAHYGAGFAQVDVTDRVRDRITNGTLNVLATTGELGCNDPLHGATKALTIDYRLNGRDRTVQIVEGSRLILP